MTRRALPAIILFILIVLVSLVNLPAGKGRLGGLDDHFLAGCGGTNCHNDSTPGLDLTLVGIPVEYEVKKVYTLRLTINSGPIVDNSSARGQGGFDLYVTGGHFQLLIPDSGDLRLGQSDRELSHTANDTKTRFWTFRWMAPEVGEGNVEFQLAVLAGNTDETHSGDQWTTLRIVSEGSHFNLRNWILKGLGLSVVVMILLYARHKLKEADRAQRAAKEEEEEIQDGDIPNPMVSTVPEDAAEDAAPDDAGSDNAVIEDATLDGIRTDDIGSEGTGSDEIPPSGREPEGELREGEPNKSEHDEGETNEKGS